MIKIKNISVFVFGLTIMCFAQLRLPKLISDGMVLQRNADVKIWGWAAKNENISVNFIDSTYQTKADNNGNWFIMLSNLNAGGPFTMTIFSSDTVKINDILIGDVWVCSGQSNMELTMKRVSPIYKKEIENSENKFIRYFEVPDKYNFNSPQKDFQNVKWQSANPQTVLNFSAVSYFFGKELYDKYKIPIGLINSALGGSPVEAWMSEDALKNFPKYYNEAQKFKDSALIKKIQDEDNARINAWYNLLYQKDEGYKNPNEIWYDSSLNTSDWNTMEIPGYWANTNLGAVNGVVWFRKEINIPKSLAGKKAKLLLGRIVDADSVFVNGIFVGTTSYQYPPRRYNISAGVLKEGKNLIVIRVISNSGKGGFVKDKPYKLIFENKEINLSGIWKFKLGAEMQPLGSQTFIRWKPLGLFNAMLAPLLNYSIKGVIWYQGETNANYPDDYYKLFVTMIKDWRKKWNQGKFPFLFVQLPNFLESIDEPSESNWALIREAQLETLSLPNTGMAVAIDIGEWNDIHPLNKKDVGFRLSLAAEKIAYGENIIYSGPIYQSMEIDSGKIILTFSNIGRGLAVKNGGKLNSFAIAGNDHKFIWANAKIINNKIMVWSDKIPNPAAVRYAWANNPENANLINKEGLPASPFRTDNW